MPQNLQVDTKQLVPAHKRLETGLKTNMSQRANLTYANGLLEIALRGTPHVAI